MSLRLIREFVREAMLEQVRKKLHIDIPGDIVNLSDAFKAAGHQLYVVGGAVRDALQGKDPKDYDLATDALPDDVIEIVGALPGHKVIELGKAFGVVVAVTPEGKHEIATFRKDIGAGRRPDSVEFTDIESDVKRRDLTINALFYDLDRREVVDFVGGIDDIERGIVRAVGDPARRFDEDRLRILRALRFAAKMGSDLDPATQQAIENDNSLHGVSPERVRDEFLKGILGAQSVPNYLDLIEEFDLWSQVFPGLTVAVVPVDSKNVPALLARLLWANDPMIAAKRLNALKYSSDECAQVNFLLRFKELSPVNAYRLKKAFASSHLTNDDITEFASLKGTPDPVLLSAFVEYELSVSGDDVKADGYQGQALGVELERRETELFNKLL